MQCLCPTRYCPVSTEWIMNQNSSQDLEQVLKESTECWWTRMVMVCHCHYHNLPCWRDHRGGSLPGDDSHLASGRAFLCLFSLSPISSYFLIPSVTLKLMRTSPSGPTNKALCINPVVISFMQLFCE